MLLWILNLDFAASGAGFIPPVVVADTTVTGGGFFIEYELYSLRKRKRRRDEERAQAEADQIQLELDREIAKLLREQEAKDAERDDLARIQSLADQYAGTRQPVTRRVSTALLKAYEERSRNALEQLEREIFRMQEEEEMAVLQILLNDD